MSYGFFEKSSEVSLSCSLKLEALTVLKLLTVSEKLQSRSASLWYCAESKLLVLRPSDIISILRYDDDGTFINVFHRKEDNACWQYTVQYSRGV